MTNWNRVQGDVNDTILMKLTAVDTLASVASVEAHVWQFGAEATTLAAAVEDAAECIVEIQLGGVSGWLSDAAEDEWQLEVQVTFDDGRIVTWPSGTPDTITVRTEGG